MYVHNREGEPLALYNFSINKANLPDRPFRAGAVYILPRGYFIRQKFGGVTPANEWASLSPVVPAASILVDPEDFPFLDRIGGHDDGPLVRAQVIQGRLLDGAEKALVLGPDMRKLVFGRQADVQTDAAEFIELQAQLMPGVGYVFDGGPPASLEIGPMPPAMVQVLDAALKERGLI